MWQRGNKVGGVDSKFHPAKANPAWRVVMRRGQGRRSVLQIQLSNCRTHWPSPSQIGNPSLWRWILPFPQCHCTQVTIPERLLRKENNTQVCVFSWLVGHAVVARSTQAVHPLFQVTPGVSGKQGTPARPTHGDKQVEGFKGTLRRSCYPACHIHPTDSPVSSLIWAWHLQMASSCLIASKFLLSNFNPAIFSKIRR